MKYFYLYLLVLCSFIAKGQVPDSSLTRAERYKPYILIYERGGKQIIYERGDMLVFRSPNEKHWNVAFIETIEPAYLNLLINNSPIQLVPADIDQISHKKYRPNSGLVQAGAGILPIAAIGYPLISMLNKAAAPSVYYTSAGLMAGGLLLRLITKPRTYKIKNGWKGKIVQADGLFYRTKLPGYDKPK